jgi:hypothetical protein
MAQQRHELSTQKRDKKREEMKEENHKEPKLEGENEESSDTDDTVSASEGEEDEEVNEGNLFVMNHPTKLAKAKRFITIGVVGHPVCHFRDLFSNVYLSPLSTVDILCFSFPLQNVGKSTLINAIKGKKVCSTSITPGHTKHFQVCLPHYILIEPPIHSFLEDCSCEQTHSIV